MRHIHHAILMAATAASLPACALDEEGAQGEATSESSIDSTQQDDSTSPSIDVAEHPVPGGKLPGWAAVDVEGAPHGTVFVTSDVTINAVTACPSGFACMYQNSNRDGFILAVQSGIAVGNFKGVPCSICTGGIHGHDGTFNDQMSSWQNASGRRYCWWFDVNFSGEVHPMENGLIVNVLSRENDRASSFGPC